MKLLEEFKRDIDGVIELLEKGEEIRARVRFNYDVRTKYKDEIKKTESTVHTFLSFFLDLDEYLNNDRLHLLGQNLTREEMIDRYYNEYLKELKSLE